MHLAQCCHRNALLLLHVEGTHVHKSCKCTAASSQSPLAVPRLPSPSLLLLPAGNGIYVQVDFATVCRLSVCPLSCSCSSSSCLQPLAISAALSRVCACVSVSLCVCVCTQVAHMMSLIRCPVVRCPLSVVRLCPVSAVRCQLTGTVQCVLRRPRSAAAHLCRSRTL